MCRGDYSERERLWEGVAVALPFCVIVFFGVDLPFYYLIFACYAFSFCDFRSLNVSESVVSIAYEFKKQ